MNSKNALTAASLIFQSSPNNAEYKRTPVTVKMPCLSAFRSLDTSGVAIFPPAFLAKGTK